jgi:hypothetical protein
LSSRIVGHLACCIVVVGATAGTLAAFSAYAMRPARVSSDFALGALALEPQTPNRSAKSHRLAALLPTRLASASDEAIYAMASAESAAEAVAETVQSEPVRATEPTPVAIPAKPAADLVAEVKIAALAPPPKEKPRHLLPPPPAAPPVVSNALDDGQIAGLKGRLRLTSDQVEFWPAVEAALRDVVLTQLRGGIKPGHARNIDVNSPEVQKLIWAAMPLLMRLREDQKTEVRKLARVIGLEQVASQI